MPSLVPDLLLILTLAALGVSLAYSIRFVKTREEMRTGVAWAANLAGLCFLLVEFLFVSFRRGQPALTVLGDSIAFFALVLLAVNNIAGRIARSHLISLFLTPVAMLVTAMALFYERLFPTGEAQRALGQGFLVLHVILFMTSYALFALAAAFGAMFLALDGSLKAKSFSPVFFKLPGLARLDSFAGRSALAGLALLTLAIAISMGKAFYTTPGSATGSAVGDFTVLTVCIIWLYYAAYALFRTRFGLVGRRSCVMTLGGLVLVLAHVGGQVMASGPLHGGGAASSSARAEMPAAGEVEP